jgi:hypothetical protein
MGFGLCRSMLLFAGFAFHGVKKYALSYLGEKHETWYSHVLYESD